MSWNCLGAWDTSVNKADRDACFLAGTQVIMINARTHIITFPNCSPFAKMQDYCGLVRLATRGQPIPWA